MSKDDKRKISTAAKPESVFQKFRSPCIDAHYEAFILRSSWTVGGLYAANLNLGQSYVKQVQDIEKQRRVWLSRKEKEREAMQRRFEALKRKAKQCFHSESVSERKVVSENRKSARQRASTVGPCCQVANLEKLDLIDRRVHFRKNRSASQPPRPGFHSTPTTNANFEFQTNESQTGKELPRSQNLSFASPYRPGPSLRKAPSVLSSYVKFARSKEAERNLSANNDLMPRWLPSNLRSKHTRGSTLI